MRARGDLCESAKKGFVCPDDVCRGADVTLCGFDKDWYDSCFDGGPDYDGEYEDEDDLYGDCSMTPGGQCMKAGSEECDWECPIMADLIRREARKKAKP